LHYTPSGHPLRHKKHPNRHAVEHAEYERSLRLGKRHFFNELFMDEFSIAVPFVKAALRLSGSYRRAKENAFNTEIVRHIVSSPALPKAFDGYTALQLSDLHIDGHPRFYEHLINLIRPLEYDAAFLTGDYRFLIWGNVETAHAYLHRLVGMLRMKSPVYGILGNHDIFLTAEFLHSEGVHMLINDSTRIERGGECLYLAGVDETIYYNAADIHAALEGCDGYTILLAHSPALYDAAAHSGVDFYLCGHTHAGQFCLPGGSPILTHFRGPRRLVKGPWEHTGMKGYTSRGAGASGIFARLNCRPEISLITFRCSDS
jgi:hypothetical protein